MVSQSLCGKRAFKICQTDGAKSNRPIDKTGGNWGLFVTAWTSCQKKQTNKETDTLFSHFSGKTFSTCIFSRNASNKLAARNSLYCNTDRQVISVLLVNEDEGDAKVWPPLSMTHLMAFSL